LILPKNTIELMLRKVSSFLKLQNRISEGKLHYL